MGAMVARVGQCAAVKVQGIWTAGNLLLALSPDKETQKREALKWLIQSMCAG